MREISAHDAFKSQVCANCEIVEVSSEGDICNSCKVVIGRVDRFWDRLRQVQKENAKPPAPKKIQNPEDVVLECKGGCGRVVATHKGMSGWCEYGCRKAEIQRRKDAGNWIVGKRRQPKKEAEVTETAEISREYKLEKPEDKFAVFWLGNPQGGFRVMLMDAVDHKHACEIFAKTFPIEDFDNAIIFNVVRISDMEQYRVGVNTMMDVVAHDG
jgi:hypothetical protein